MEKTSGLHNKPIELRAPNGEKSNLSEELWHFVRTRAFKERFGDWEKDPDHASTFVDENGEPKVFYFGGPTGIQRLNRDNPRNTGKRRHGFYVTPRTNYARFYAHKYAAEEVEEGRIGASPVYTSFLCARNVLTVHKGAEFSPSSIHTWPDPYDAIIDNRTGTVHEVVVRDAGQVIIAKEERLKDTTSMRQ